MNNLLVRGGITIYIRNVLDHSTPNTIAAIIVEF